MRKKGFVKHLWGEIQEDDVMTGGAALAFYMMLSIFPAAIFLLTLLPYLPVPDLQSNIMNLLHQAMPEQAAGLFQGVVEKIASEKKGGLLTFGILFTLWSASTGVYALMQQLNSTYDVEESRPFWKKRGLAVVLMLLFVVLVIGAFALIIGGGAIHEQLSRWLGRSSALLIVFSILRWAIVALLLLLGLSVIYAFGPDADQKFEFVTPGSLIGLILLVITSLGFRYYISNFGNYSATYGSLGAVIVLMMWLYITGVVILIGSEINAVWRGRSSPGA